VKSTRAGLVIGVWLLVGVCLLLLPPKAFADEGGDGSGDVYGGAPLRLGQASPIAIPGDAAPLWNYIDPTLQRQMESAMEQLGLADDIRRKRLSFALVDVTDPARPRVATMNPDVMLYAASLPKIAILLAAYEQISKGRLKLDAATKEDLQQMIWRSSNSASTRLMHKVGKERIAEVLLSDRYRLYDPERGGGLWAGKDYGKGGLWRRDPIHNLSHGATAMQVARYYYMLETGALVSPEYSKQMKRILGTTQLTHKFVRGLLDIDPSVHIYRKSGSWRTFHSDSALVKRDGRAYIAVALSNDPAGSAWMIAFIHAADQVMFADRNPTKAAKQADRNGSKRGKRR